MVLPALQKLEGKYEILEKLAEGGMGAVYKVRHLLLDEIRVVKVMRPHLEDDEHLRRRFLREARSAVKLRHPNIAQIYDFTIAEDGTSYMVMEFIDGKNLIELRRLRGRLSVGLALEIGVQSLSALSYLHQCHFVHRDISPDNLMLTTDLKGDHLVKLIDLGIAKPLAGEVDLTQAGLFLGKIQYASPEQFGGSKGGAKVDRRSDIYSFGVVLYEALTGQHPFPGDNYQALVAAHLFRPPKDFSETDPESRIPAVLREAVLRALEKEPEDRFPDAETLSEVLQEIQQDWHEPEEEEPLTTVIMRPGKLIYDKPGTTQERLDRTFGTEPTPRPVALEAVGEADEPDPTELAEKSCKLIEELFGEGRLNTAERELAKALEEIGQHELLEGLRRRLEEIRARSQALQGRARRSQEAGKLEKARLALAEARALDTENEELEARLAEIDAAIKEQVLVADARHAIESHLDRAELSEARRALEEAEQAFAAHQEFVALRARLDELQAAEARAKAMAARGREVEALIEKAKLDEAATVLEEARQEYGEEESFAQLAQRIAAAEAELERQRLEQEKKKRERRAQALLRKAAQAAEQKDFAVALEKAEAARALTPENPELAELVARYRTSLERQREEQRRAAALDEAAASVSAALESGDVDTAEQALAQAERDLGSAEVLDTLKARLEALRLEQRQAQAAELLQEAELLLESDELQAAAERTEQSLALNPESPRGRSLREQIRRRQEAEERARAAAHEARRIEDLLAAGQLAEAEAAFVEAQHQFEDVEALKRTGELLTQKRQENQARVEAWVAEASELTEAGDLGAAIRLLREAVLLAPANQEAQDLLQATEQQLQQQRQQEERARAIAAATEKVDALMATGSLRRASWTLKKSRRQLGDDQALVEIGEALDRLRHAAAEHSPLGNLSQLLRHRVVLLGAGGILLAVLAVTGLNRIRSATPDATDSATQPQREDVIVSTAEEPAPDTVADETAGGTPVEQKVEVPPAKETVKAESVEQRAPVKTRRTEDQTAARNPLQRAATLAMSAADLYAQGDRAGTLKEALAALQLEPQNRTARRLIVRLSSEARQGSVTAQRLADGFEAARRAPGLYSRASVKDQEARRSLQDLRAPSAIRLWNESSELFRRAGTEAQRVAELEAAVATAAAGERTRDQPAESQQSEIATFAEARPSPPSSSGGGAERPQPPATGVDDTDAVVAVLDAVEQAYGNLDIDALRRVWPRLSGRRLQAIEKSFAEARSFEVTVDRCSIDIAGNSATAACRMRQTYRPKRGTRQSVDRQVTFRLQKSRGEWRLEGF